MATENNKVRIIPVVIFKMHEQFFWSHIASQSRLIREKHIRSHEFNKNKVKESI